MKDYIMCASACGGGPDKGRMLPTVIQRRACRRRMQGGIAGARLVRSSGHKLSFVCSMSPPEIVGNVDSTVCTLHLNKAGKEAGGVGEGALRKGKVS